MLPGCKPSLAVYKLPGCDGETVMQGLDSLAERLREYKAAGCVFAKWRSPLDIDVAAGKPSQLAIECNMRDQARDAGFFTELVRATFGKLVYSAAAEDSCLIFKQRLQVSMASSISTEREVKTLI